MFFIGWVLSESGGELPCVVSETFLVLGSVKDVGLRAPINSALNSHQSVPQRFLLDDGILKLL